MELIICSDPIFYPRICLRWRHTIRNCIFWHQSLEISYFWLRIQDSRHFQLAIYTVFHEESESAVRIDQFLHPEEKIKKNQPTRVSISYRKISYYMSPLQFLFVNVVIFCVLLYNRYIHTVETYDKKSYDKTSRLQQVRFS